LKNDHRQRPATTGNHQVKWGAIAKAQVSAAAAHTFDFDYPDGRTAEAYAADAIAAVWAWQHDPDRGTLTMATTPDGTIRLADTRFGAPAPTWTVLTGWQAAVYALCDRSRREEALARSAAVDEHALRTFLDRCTAGRTMVQVGCRWLSLAVHVPAREPRTGQRSTARQLV
jgi:hypothetical protein